MFTNSSSFVKLADTLVIYSLFSARSRALSAFYRIDSSIERDLSSFSTGTSSSLRTETFLSTFNSSFTDFPPSRGSLVLFDSLDRGPEFSRISSRFSMCPSREDLPATLSFCSDGWGGNSSSTGSYFSSSLAYKSFSISDILSSRSIFFSIRSAFF